VSDPLFHTNEGMDESAQRARDCLSMLKYSFELNPKRRDQSRAIGLPATIQDDHQ